MIRKMCSLWFSNLKQKHPVTLKSVMTHWCKNESHTQPNTHLHTYTDTHTGLKFALTSPTQAVIVSVHLRTAESHATVSRRPHLVHYRLKYLRQNRNQTQIFQRLDYDVFETTRQQIIQRDPCRERRPFEPIMFISWEESGFSCGGKVDGNPIKMSNVPPAQSRSFENLQTQRCPRSQFPRQDPCKE